MYSLGQREAFQAGAWPVWHWGVIWKSAPAGNYPHPLNQGLCVQVPTAASSLPSVRPSAQHRTHAQNCYRGAKSCKFAFWGVLITLITDTKRVQWEYAAALKFPKLISVNPALLLINGGDHVIIHSIQTTHTMHIFFFKFWNGRGF